MIDHDPDSLVCIAVPYSWATITFYGAIVRGRNEPLDLFAFDRKNHLWECDHRHRKTALARACAEKIVRT